MITFKEQFEKTKGKYYLYALIRPDKNGEYFYIGKGKKKRVFGHFKKSQSNRNPYKWRIIQKILSQGYNQEDMLKILMITDSEEYANDMEKALIKRIGRHNLGTGPLTNMTDGGEGSTNLVVSEETRKLIGSLSRGRIHSEETKREMSINRTGEKNHRFGKKFSEETCRKISETRLRKPMIATNNKTEETIYFASTRDAAKAGFEHAIKVAKGQYKFNKGHSFRYATLEEIEKYST